MLPNGVFLDYATLKPDDLLVDSLNSSFSNLTLHPTTSPTAVTARLQNTHTAIVNKVKIGRKELSLCPDLRLIMVAATGTDNIDKNACKECGVALANVPAYGTSSVAQHTIMLMLMLTTQIERYRSDVKSGQWTKSPFFCLMNYPVMELSGKTLGIIGFGELGREVGRLATAFGMRVRIMGRPNTTYPPSQKRDCLVTLLSNCDFVTLHGLLTADNYQFMDKKAFSLMRSGSFLINTARGGLVDEDALVDALESDHLGGAAVDVLFEEPPPADSRLLSCRHPNLIITPHSAWISRQARQKIIDILVENLDSFLDGTKLNRIV